MDIQTVKWILGSEQTPEQFVCLIDLIKTHLALDNNKLREDFVCSLMGYTPSYGGVGHPDGYKPDGTCVDNKSGPNIIFPDGAVSITKKHDWVCLVHEFTKEGQLIYVAEVAVSDIMDELVEDAAIKTAKGGRVSPACSHSVWLKKENTKILYKNPSLYPLTKSGKSVVRRFLEIDELDYTKTQVI